MTSYPGSPEVCYLMSGLNGGRTVLTTSVGPTKTIGLISHIPNKSGSVTTRTEIATLDSDSLSLLSYGTFVPAVTLIYKEGDVGGKTGDGHGETTTGFEETTTAGEATTAESTANGDSAASGIQRNRVVSLFGITLGILAGAGMLIG